MTAVWIVLIISLLINGFNVWAMGRLAQRYARAEICVSSLLLWVTEREGDMMWMGRLYRKHAGGRDLPEPPKGVN